MSVNKHSNSKGQKNPNSKNPATGGGVRSSSSPHSPAVGTQDSAFVRAIISNILTQAKKAKVPVTHDEARFFAIAYAEANPPINLPRGRQFEQEHVDAAFEQFKEQYQPPQPAPQPRNPNNIFGQLLRLGRHLRIPNETLIDYLKWFTSQPHIREIAENPSEEDVNNGYHEMLKAISPGAEMFRNVCKRGLSSETLGSNFFRKLMQMKNGPKHHPVYGIQNCPNLRELIRAFSFKGEIDGSPYVGCFISGFFIELNGGAVQFNYPNFENPLVGWNCDNMIGKPVIFWISEVGQVIYTKTVRQFDSGQHDYTLGIGHRGADYAGGGIAYNHGGEVCTWGTLKLDALNQEMSDDKRAFFEREHVTAPERENLYVGKNHEIERKIRSDPKYQAACEKAMAQIGGISISFCHSHQEATAAEGSDHCDAAAPVDDIMIFCYHSNCIMSHGNYTPCLDCKSHPGKQPIMDGWGTDVVGYRQEP